VYDPESDKFWEFGTHNITFEGSLFSKNIHSNPVKNCTIEDFEGVEDKFEKMQGGVPGSLLCFTDLLSTPMLNTRTYDESK
jgi:hypothetical protein